MAQTITAETPIKKIDAKDTYLTLDEGQHVIYLVAPIYGGLVKYDQVWLFDKEGKMFPVQSFAAEMSDRGEDVSNDPATVFVQKPENKSFVKSAKPQTSYRMVVAIEVKGEFVLRVLNLKKGLAEALTNLVAHNDAIGGSLLDNADCLGTKVSIKVSKSGRKAYGYDIMEFNANIVPQKNKPDFSALVDELAELNIEDGLGGKTPADVVARINERGLPFDFVVATK